MARSARRVASGMSSDSLRPSSSTGRPVVANAGRAGRPGVSYAGKGGRHAGSLRSPKRTVTVPAISMPVPQTGGGLRREGRLGEVVHDRAAAGAQIVLARTDPGHPLV